MEDELQVLEINPRTTTSYVGLRSSIGINPAGLILDLWRDGALPKLPRIAARQVDVMIS
jgi:predicted ATP-grasp superfamily ATP-dependent carboligase